MWDKNGSIVDWKAVPGLKWTHLEPSRGNNYYNKDYYNKDVIYREYGTTRENKGIVFDKVFQLGEWFNLVTSKISISDL